MNIILYVFIYLLTYWQLLHRAVGSWGSSQSHSPNWTLIIRCLIPLLSQVVSQRFPQNSIGAVGSAMFLRFINPAIVSPYETGILDKKPPLRIERGLKLMSKVWGHFSADVHDGYSSVSRLLTTLNTWTPSRIFTIKSQSRGDHTTSYFAINSILLCLMLVSRFSVYLPICLEKNV